VASIATIARRWGGTRQGHNWCVPCRLGCEYDLLLAEGENGIPLVWGPCGHGFNDILPFLIDAGLHDEDDADGGDFIVDHRHRRRDPEHDQRRIEDARWLYHHFSPGTGTIIEPYIQQARGIPGAVSEVLRFGTYYHRVGRNFPAMLAPIINVDGELTAVHVTMLRPDGSGKADVAKGLQRETQGVIRGGTIRLIPHDPNRELIIAEGIETSLSASVIFGDLPAWSAVFAGGLKTVELPAEVRRIVIACDHDLSGCGQHNALTAYDRFVSEGRSVRIVMPPVAGDDFNDVLERRDRERRSR
jgi:hypothetical protein